MWLELVTPPSVLPLTLAEVKTYVRVDYSEDDDLIAMLIASGVAALDGWSEGKLGRALITQGWRMHLDGFPSVAMTRANLGAADRARADGIVFAGGNELAITLPLPPLQTVNAVKYLDTDGVEQTVAPDSYVVEARGGAFGRIRLADGASWPSYRAETGCVRIEFTVGYGDDSGDVPAPIRHAMLMAIADAYDNRGVGNNQVTMTAYDNLLSPYRVLRF